MRRFVPLLLLCLAFAQAGAAETAGVPVTVVVEGFKTTTGACKMLVFAVRKGFPGDPAKAVAVVSGAIDGAAARFSLTLSSGVYAVSVFHDENANGRLDTTWYGKPTEGYGTSNDPPARTGPPSFAASCVTIDGTAREIRIRLKYR